MSAAEEPSNLLAALREALARTRKAGTARVMLDQVWKMRRASAGRAGRAAP